jgi:hypothetical protein
MQKLILAVTLFMVISIPPVFAQEQLGGQNILLNIDKDAYNEGDVITITGNVEKVVAGLQVSLQIFFEKNLIQIDQVPVTEDGQFSTTFVAEGKQWQNEGVVIIKATYGAGSTAEISASFFKDTGAEFLSIYEVDIPDGGTFDINYTMKGGIVKSMNIDSNELSLNVIINTNTNGALSIDIPRFGFDAINENGSDEKFIVLIYTKDNTDPIQTDFRVLDTTAESRSIYIPIRDGDMKIQIIGTKVIPEFGVMIQFSLIIAIIAAIIISARTKLDIFPKL